MPRSDKYFRKKPASPGTRSADAFGLPLNGPPLRDSPRSHPLGGFDEGMLLAFLIDVEGDPFGESLPELAAGGFDLVRPRFAGGDGAVVQRRHFGGVIGDAEDQE